MSMLKCETTAQFTKRKYWKLFDGTFLQHYVWKVLKVYHYQKLTTKIVWIWRHNHWCPKSWTKKNWRSRQKWTQWKTPKFFFWQEIERVRFSTGSMTWK